MKQRLSYFLFELKRCFHRIGKLLAALLLLGAVCFITVFGFSSLSENDEPVVSDYTVVFVMPEDAGLHYTLALGFVSNMESLSGLCSIKRTTSEDTARQMLEDGTASAMVIIPEGMIHTILSGTNDLPARIYYPGKPSLETILFRQIVDCLSQMVARSQTGIYTLYELYDQYGADSRTQDKANSEMNNLYISTVLDRTSTFREEPVSAYDFGDTESFLSKALALLFLLSGINLCSFLMPSGSTIRQALRRLGLSGAYCLAADFAAAFLCQFIVFLTFYLLLWLIGLNPALGCSILLLPAIGSAAAAAFFSCAVSVFLCRICSSKQACVIAAFFVSLLLMYASGGLLPAVFLPDFLRSLSGFLPGTQLIRTIGWAMTGLYDPMNALILAVEAMILLAAACLYDRLQEGRTI